jgi:hypothetical protein
MTYMFDDKKFFLGVTIALVYTGIFLISDVQWSFIFEKKMFLSTSMSLFVALFFAGIPYTGLRRLLKKSSKFPNFQWCAFVLMIALPLLMLPAFKVRCGGCEGWQYFLIPFLQIFLYGLLNISFKILTVIDNKRSSTDTGLKP